MAYNTKSKIFCHFKKKLFAFKKKLIVAGFLSGPPVCQAVKMHVELGFLSFHPPRRYLWVTPFRISSFIILMRKDASILDTCSSGDNL